LKVGDFGLARIVNRDTSVSDDFDQYDEDDEAELQKSNVSSTSKSGLPKSPKVRLYLFLNTKRGTHGVCFFAVIS